MKEYLKKSIQSVQKKNLRKNIQNKKRSKLKKFNFSILLLFIVRM